MASVIFLVLWLIFSAIPIIGLNAFTFQPMVFVIWFFSILFGFLMALLSVVLFLAFYGHKPKEITSENIHYHKVINSILRLIVHLVRARVVITGVENIPKQNFILVSNHQSAFDLIILKPIFANRPLIFIGKQVIFDWPIIGRWASLLGNISIYRESDRSAIESIIKGIKAYEQGYPVFIFPEGTRSRSNQMGPFKAGAFKLAMKPKADILIATVYNMEKIWRFWPFKRQTVHVHFHKLLIYDEYQHMNSQTLSEHVKNIIQKQLDSYMKG